MLQNICHSFMMYIIIYDKYYKIKYANKSKKHLGPQDKKQEILSDFVSGLLQHIFQFKVNVP